MSDFQGTMAARLDAAPQSQAVRLSLLADGIREFLDDAIDAVGIEAFIATAHNLYDTYVAPMTPGPALLDSAAKQVLSALIIGVHERIHTAD